MDGRARTPSLPSCSARRSAPRLVRTKTIVRLALRAMAAATLTLSIWWTWRKRCSISSTVTDADSTSCMHRVVLVALDQRVDHAVEGGREQQRLVRPARRGAGSTRPGAGSPCRPCGRPRRGPRSRGPSTDTSLRSIRSIMRPGVATTTSTPLAKRLDLALHVGAAVDGDEPHVPGASASGGQLVVAPGAASSRVGTSTRARRAPRGSAVRDPLEDRQAEGQGLARAGLGLAADVAAGQGVGDGERLDGERRR